MFDVIKRNPALPLSQIGAALVRPPRRQPAGDPGCSYTGYARFALANVLRLLALERGSEVLLPAYICDAVLLPFAELGLVPVYYAVDDRFHADFDTIPWSRRTRVLLTVNYFGMSANLEAMGAFAQSHDLVWINDNSHGFAARHGGKKLESFGDFSVTSFRKVIPSINGARACVNSEKYALHAAELRRMNAPADREHGGLPRFLMATLLAHLRYRPTRLPKYEETSAPSGEEMLAVRLDRLSGNVLEMTREDDVQAKRYAVYQAVDEFITGHRPSGVERLNGLLRVGNSPMVYPIAVRERPRWLALLAAGHELGIDVHPWPSLPAEVIAADTCGAETQWQQLLFLPIHQDLDHGHYCARLARMFER